MDFLSSASNKEPAYQMGWIPGLGRFPGGEHGNSFQYSGLENPREQRSLAGCSLWGCREVDMNERLSTHTHLLKV